MPEGNFVWVKSGQDQYTSQTLYILHESAADFDNGESSTLGK